MPQARFGVLVPGQPSHTGGDQPIPVCSEAIADGEGIHYAPFLSAVSELILGFVMIGAWLGGGNFLKSVEKGRLVGFDLGEDIAPRRLRRSSSDTASHRRCRGRRRASIHGSALEHKGSHWSWHRPRCGLGESRSRWRRRSKGERPCRSEERRVGRGG